MSVYWRSEDVSDGCAGFMGVSILVGSLCWFVSQDRWDRLFHVCLSDTVVKWVRRFVVMTCGCVAVGILSSALIRALMGHYSSISASSLDPVNEVDRLAQMVAIAGAVPFVFLFRVLPRFIYYDIVVVVGRWFLIAILNILIASQMFLANVWGHLVERCYVVWKWAHYIGEILIIPIQKLCQFIWTVIAFIIDQVWFAISTTYKFISFLFSTLTLLVVHSILTPIYHLLVALVVAPVTHIALHALAFLHHILSTITTNFSLF